MDEGCARLCRWLTAGGADLRGLFVDEGRDGEPRGVRAGQDIADGSAALVIPRSLLITTEVAEASPIGQAILAIEGELVSPDHSLLAAYLLEERRRGGSPFAPYLDTLPESFPTHPLFFSDDEMAWLRGSYATAKVGERRRSIDRDYAAISSKVQAFRAFSREELAWARVAVSSRVFGVRIGGVATQALVPMADMLNHAPSPEVHWAYDDEANAFLMKAARAIAKGTAVRDSYGSKCNGRFFVSYGFTLADNPANEAAVMLAIPEGAARREEKRKLLGVRGDGPSPFLVGRRLDADATWKALSFLRVACATEREMEAWGARPIAAHDVPVVSARNEVGALRLLAAACERALGGFETGIEEDDVLLAGGGLTARQRHCVVMRRGEKRVLRRVIELSRGAMPWLRMPWPMMREGVKGLRGGYWDEVLEGLSVR